MLNPLRNIIFSHQVHSIFRSNPCMQDSQSVTFVVFLHLSQEVVVVFFCCFHLLGKRGSGWILWLKGKMEEAANLLKDATNIWPTDEEEATTYELPKLLVNPWTGVAISALVFSSMYALVCLSPKIGERKFGFKVSQPIGTDLPPSSYDWTNEWMNQRGYMYIYTYALCLWWGVCVR